MKPILKQTSWLFVAQTLTRVIGFFYIIYLAKILGVSDFGLYTVALAYFSIISSIADFGFNRFLIREVAKDKTSAPGLLWNICLLRLTLTAILFAVFAVALYAFDPDKMRVSLALLAALAILPQGVGFSFDAIFTAIRKLQFSAVALFLAGLSTALLGVFLAGRGFGPIGAVNAFIFGQIIYAFVLIIFLAGRREFAVSGIHLSIIKKAVIGSLPYGLLSVLGLLYFKIDSVLLSYIKGNFETGIYGAAYRFLEAIVFIPSAFGLALFPVLARLHESGPQKIKPLYLYSLKVMAILGLLVTAGYLLILPILISIFLPQFMPSVNVIKILALAIPFMFVHIPGVQILFSTDKYLKQIILLSVFTLSFNIILNLILIPAFGYMAAAWVTVASEVLSFLVFFQLLRIKVLK